MEDLEVGQIVKGQVTGVTKYGVFVRLNNDYDGMVHISEVSDKFVKDMNSQFIVGDIIKVKILEIDETKSQVKLSIKKLKYKINPKKIKLPENGEGFIPLEENLNKWVETKMEEINIK